jgi:hypothetical protein
LNGYENNSRKKIRLKNNDLKLREKLIQEGELGNGYHSEIEKLHKETLNT